MSSETFFALELIWLARVVAALHAAFHPGRYLPIDDGAIVGIILGTVWVRFTNLGHEFVFVNRDTQARLGQQRTMPVGDGRQRLRQQFRVLSISALLNEEIWDGRRNL